MGRGKIRRKPIATAKQRDAKSCKKKVRHLSRNNALAHAFSLHRGSGAQVKPYKCSSCGFWHVGHRFGGRV